MLLHLWFFFNLICNRTMFWTSWILTYWPQGMGGGGGVCRQNICHHFAALVICLNLICNMVMFWRSWILSFWPQPLSPPRGSDRGLWSKITFDMFHIYYTSWHKFWHLDPQCWQGGGWSLLAKYFLPCCCICDSSLIWYATGPCSQQVEFWPIDPQCWRGGGWSAGKIFPTMLLHM